MATVNHEGHKVGKDKRREYGTGSLYQRKSDGMWVGTIEAGWTADGRRRRITVSAKSQDRAKAKLRDKRRELDLHGDTGVNARATVKTWAEEWLAIIERKKTPNAFNADRSAVRRWIVPTIGHKRFDALTPADVRAVANAQRKAGRASSTQLRTHSVLTQMLKAAQVEGYPVPPRLFNVMPPSKGVSDRTDMSVPEAVAILEQAATLPHGSRWVAALLQGMRQGESLGLTWDFVDLDRGLITLAWQQQPLTYNVRYDRTSGFRVPDGYEARQLVDRWHLVRPKSKAGWRVIPLVPWMRSALTAWREIAPENPHGLVWPAADGRPRQPKDDDAEFYALQAAAGVHHPTRVTKDGEPAPFTMHENRHTTATLLLEAGVDPVVIVKILGHSTILTSRGYMHAKTEQAMDALTRVAERLGLPGE